MIIMILIIVTMMIIRLIIISGSDQTTNDGKLALEWTGSSLFVIISSVGNVSIIINCIDCRVTIDIVVIIDINIIIISNDGKMTMKEYHLTWLLLCSSSLIRQLSLKEEF